MGYRTINVADEVWEKLNEVKQREGTPIGQQVRVMVEKREKVKLHA
jgi:predicted CopG family antitoxin